MSQNLITFLTSIFGHQPHLSCTLKVALGTYVAYNIRLMPNYISITTIIYKYNILVEMLRLFYKKNAFKKAVDRNVRSVFIQALSIVPQNAVYIGS